MRASRALKLKLRLQRGSWRHAFPSANGALGADTIRLQQDLVLGSSPASGKLSAGATRGWLHRRARGWLHRWTWRPGIGSWWPRRLRELKPTWKVGLEPALQLRKRWLLRVVLDDDTERGERFGNRDGLRWQRRRRGSGRRWRSVARLRSVGRMRHQRWLGLRLSAGAAGRASNEHCRESGGVELRHNRRTPRDARDSEKSPAVNEPGQRGMSTPHESIGAASAAVGARWTDRPAQSSCGAITCAVR